MEEKSFKVGDEVYLKSDNSILMIITTITSDLAACVFFDKWQELKSVTLPIVCLKAA